MNINRRYSITNELLAFLLEDGVRLLIIAIKHVQLTVRGAYEYEVIAHGDAVWLALVKLPLDCKLGVDLFHGDFLGKSVLENGLGGQTLSSNVRVLVEVLLRVNLMPSLVPVDEPDHVDRLLREICA